MLTRLSLQYLADRLQPIEEPDCIAAHDLILDAINNYEAVARSTRAEKELCEELWDHITHALDHGEYSPVYQQVLDAIEAELCGRVLFMRLSDGTLTGPATARPPGTPVQGLFARWVGRKS